jgi:hypothetical protein
VEQRHQRLPSCEEDGDERGRRDHGRSRPCGSWGAVDVALRRPSPQAGADHHPGLAIPQDERAIRQLVERSLVVPLGAGTPEAFSVEPDIDGAGACLPRMAFSPDRLEPNVVGSPTERAGTVPGSERRRLVEEEELGEPTRLHQGLSMPATEPEATGDPASAVVVPADPALRVVEAAPVAVDETAGGIGDQLSERCHTVLERHEAITVAVLGDATGG